jgi:uncharacterized protein YbcI
LERPSEPGRTDPSVQASDISREIVRLHARMFGRGPTRAKTYLTASYALCLLEDVLTRAEKTLVDAGNTDQVRATRQAFQEAVRGDFVEIVESITGREVRAFISEIHLNPEFAVELFLFEREGTGEIEPEPEEEDGG